MCANKRAPETAEDPTQPFFYEIRVKGRLSEEQWTGWFNNLVVSYRKGESTLRGQVPDHSALYGLLARLRDLTIPLQSVGVLDASARRKLDKQSRRLDAWYVVLMITVYLSFLGGLTAITVYLTEFMFMNTALALAILLASLGALAFAFGIWSGKKLWNWVTWIMWPAAVITFFIYLAVDELMPAPLSIALQLFFLGGGLLYLLYYIRRRADEVNQSRLEWESISENGIADPIDSTDAAPAPGAIVQKEDDPDQFAVPGLEEPEQSFPKR